TCLFRGLPPSDLRSCFVTIRAHLLYPFRRPNGLDNRERLVIGGDRLLQTRRSALTLPQTQKRGAARNRRCHALQRHPLARGFLERLVIGGVRLLQTRRPALPLPQPRKRVATVILLCRPLQRHPLARGFLERLVIGGDRLLQMRRPALALPQTQKRG